MRRTSSLPSLQTPYIVNGACPFEGCTYGMWTASKTTHVVERPGSKKILWDIVEGERVAAITGELHVQPVKGEVIGETDQASIGQPVFLLDYLGEGASNIWARGVIVPNWKLISDCKPAPSCQSAIQFPVERAPAEWWVKVVRRNQQFGWARVDDNFFGNSLLEKARTDVHDPFDALPSTAASCRYPVETSENRWLMEAALGRLPGQCVSFPYLAKYSNPEPVMPLYHAGVDINAKHQTAYAVADGEVVVDCGRGDGEDDTACRDSMGIVMIKTMINGREQRVIYVHLANSYVRKGATVRQGDAIGLTGNRFGFKSDGAGEAHLHLEVRPDYSGTAALGRVSCQPGGCDTPEKVRSKTLDPSILSPVILKCGQAHNGLEFTKEGKIYFNQEYLGALGYSNEPCPDWASYSGSKWNERACSTVRQFPVSPLKKYALVIFHNCDLGGLGGAILDFSGRRIIARSILPADGYPYLSTEIYWSPSENYAVVPIQKYENDKEALNLINLETGTVVQKEIKIGRRSDCEMLSFKRVIWWDTPASFLAEVEVYASLAYLAPETCKGLGEEVRLLRTQYIRYDIANDRFTLYQ
jgi:murein DD-endopeptidase MepM/ murein hydrolase activator NlpD